MIFSLAYDIPNRGLCTHDYLVDHSSVENLVTDWLDYKSRIEIAYADPENELYFTGYTEFHKIVYVYETLMGEANLNSSTTMSTVEDYMRIPDDTRTSYKINNLKKAVDVLFPQNFEFSSKLPIEQFTPKFIKAIHKHVASGVIQDAGKYRKILSAPSQDAYYRYLEPEHISECLDNLCKFVRDEITKEPINHTVTRDCLLNRVKIVATFCANFLHIHPFSNGNGRVSRLLLSWLMSDLSVVPVPIFMCLASRDTYLDCLRYSQLSSPIIPTNFARLIFESIVHCHRLVSFCLDI